MLLLAGDWEQQNKKQQLQKTIYQMGKCNTKYSLANFTEKFQNEVKSWFLAHVQQ